MATGDPMTYFIKDDMPNKITFADMESPRMDEMDKKLEKICERLAILDDPDPEKLKKFKMLKDAYTKYKFIEELCSEEDDNNG